MTNTSSFTRASIVIFFAMLAVALAAPITVKEPSSNKVIPDDEQYLSQDEKERVVAGLILQIARDFDEGRFSLDDFEGRSVVYDYENPEVDCSSEKTNINERAIYEEPARTNEKLVPEEPARTNEKPVPEEPARTNEKLVSGEPARTNEKLVSEEPARTDEKLVSGEPVRTNEKLESEEPARTNEQLVSQEPPRTSEVPASEEPPTVVIPVKTTT